MRMATRWLVTLIILVSGALCGPRATASCQADTPARHTAADTVTAQQDTVTLREAIHNTWQTLKETHRVELKDTVIKYPKFIRFCLNVYKWFDRNFNSYDPEYVSGTGKNGKVRLVSDNWTDLHTFQYTEVSPLIMVSNPYSNIGIQANYSILSAGFSIDLNAAVSGKKSHHKKSEFGISTARVFLETFYWRNTGETVIRRFGNHQTGHLDHVKFDGLNSRVLGLGGFYFFNYRKFSFPAAYNLSNYQLKSAGSAIAGITGKFFDCEFDFTRLPQNVLDETRLPFESYRFDYNAVSAMGGYSYNWVINKHLLFNVSAFGGMGAGFSFSDATAGRTVNWAASVRVWNSLTYTTRQFFVNITNKFQGNFLLTHALAFMSGIENFQVSTGVRF